MGLRMIVGGRRIDTPFFAATVADDERLWSWRRKVGVQALLISYDVLRLDPLRAGQTLPKTLQSKVPVIVDSGGYGLSVETSAAAVYKLQTSVDADVGVTLDYVALSTQTVREQQLAIDRTVRNAAIISRMHRGRMALEGVIQGATPEQLAACARRLARLQLDVYGVPVSNQSKYRRYGAALERIAYGASALPASARIHALGCGSRTLMAILAAVGVRVFDSQSYYKRALYGENIDGITMCVFGKPRGISACDACMLRRRPGRTLEGRTDYNLFEINKEIFRIRCALRESVMTEYLRRRLKVRGATNIFDKLKALQPLLGKRLRVRI